MPRTILLCASGMALCGIFLAFAAEHSSSAVAPTQASDADPVKLGLNASLGGRRPFPDNNPWNQDIFGERVDPKSDVYVASIGADTELHPDWGKENAMPYSVVSGDQLRVPIAIRDASESDPGPFPIPADAMIEGQRPSGRDPCGGDRHVLVIDRDNWVLYEMFASVRVDGGKSWKCSSSARFDLSTNHMMGPSGWTSTDAAGFPVFLGLVRGDEVFDLKEIRHAVRFTCARTRRAFVSPATHWASDSTDPKLPPMGMRVRLRANYDISGFPEPIQVVLKGLKQYGMLLSDNGGDWFITGSPDPRWENAQSDTLKKIKGKDLEVTFMEFVTADPRPDNEVPKDAPTTAPAEEE